MGPKIQALTGGPLGYLPAWPMHDLWLKGKEFPYDAMNPAGD